MGRFHLLVLTLSYFIQPGESQIDGVTIAETVTEALRPDITQIREDVTVLKSNLTELCHKVEILTEQVVNLTERLDQIENLREQGNSITERVDKLTECVEQQKHEWGQKLTSIEKNLGFTCGGTGGWRQVVFLNVTNPKTLRPFAWRTNVNPKRTFRARSTCGSAFYPVSGGPYNQVCGMIRAYQWGEPHYAFRGLEYSIDDPYFTGVAVTHGNPRQHIWTFTTGKWENDTNNKVVCPCDTESDIAVPDFVGKDYFCESGYIYPGYYNQTELSRFHSEDVLWDGKDCHTTSKCCSLNSPPYFTKLLSQTSDDIEVRLCKNYGGHIELEHVELYVKQDYTQEKQEKTDKLLKKAIQHQVNNLHVHQCGGTGGWRRAMYLDMTDPLTECPDGWQLTGFSKRTCSTSRNYRSCDSTFLPVGGGPYNQVCGRIRAYQFGRARGLFDGRLEIDNAYIDGVAVMHGIPRNHIWTFAAGMWENAWRIEQHSNYFNCPCDSGRRRSPAFVGDDYFCESGYVHPGYRNYNIEQSFHYNDTLWDGQDCLSTSTCCSRNNPPYFTKNLSRVTTDDLELRICKTFPFSNTAVEFVEMYVKLNPAIDLTADNSITESLPQPVYYDSSIHVHTCGGTGGWRRAVFLDMTDPNTDCPDGWKLTDYSKRTCYQHRPTYYANCSSAFFPVSGGAYHHVCGRIRAYQHGYATGFYLSLPEKTIDDPYFDGLAVMHGQRPRHHIWTFAVGIEENTTRSRSSLCPCDGGYSHPPPFVEEDYFCESGYIYPGYRDIQRERQLHYNDTLWDGEDCHETSTCCSLNNPPYFTKTLSKITDDDLEVRACALNTYPVAIELVELYVKL